MEYGYTIIFVKDVPKTLEFYRNVFGFKIKHIQQNNQYGELDSGNTTISFACMHTSLKEEEINAVAISFVSHDVPADFKRAVDNGAIPVAEPREKPWGQMVSYVKDLNGLLVEISSKFNRK